jgi:hypothetical protein
MALGRTGSFAALPTPMARGHRRPRALSRPSAACRRASGHPHVRRAPPVLGEEYTARLREVCTVL